MDPTTVSHITGLNLYRDYGFTSPANRTLVDAVNRELWGRHEFYSRENLAFHNSKLVYASVELDGMLLATIHLDRSTRKYFRVVFDLTGEIIKEFLWVASKRIAIAGLNHWIGQYRDAKSEADRVFNEWIHITTGRLRNALPHAGDTMQTAVLATLRDAVANAQGTNA